MGFRPLPHVKHMAGGMVFPKKQIDEIKKQEARDLSGSTSTSTCPITSRPSSRRRCSSPAGPIWATSRRARCSRSRTYYKLLNGKLTPVQMEGLRLLLTPFPQQQFNQTEDRKVHEPSLGVTCLDCHANGHTNGTFHENPDTRPQADALPHRDGQPPRRVQPADSRLEALAALDRGLHRVRAADRLLRRRPCDCRQEGRVPARTAPARWR